MELVTTELSSETHRMRQEINNLQAAQKRTESKLDEYEGWSRRNNVRIIGVPERAEGPAADLFVEDLIMNHLKPKRLSQYFTMERAHRLPGGRLKPGAPPRPILAKLLNFRDRDIILQTARSNLPIRYENNELSFFSNFTTTVQRQRRTFLNIKKQLRDKGI